MKNRILLLVMLIGLSPLAANANVTFYGQCDYKGNGVALSAGDYTAAELAKYGIPEDAISSIDVPRGFVVTVHENDNFSGRYGTLRRSDSCLDGDRFSNTISSVSIREAFGSGGFAATTPAKPATAEQVIVYSECNFRGLSASLDSGDFNQAQLEKLGMPNNAISSIRVPEGAAVSVYEHDFLRGRAGSLYANAECLVNDNFNDMISSISVRFAADVNTTATVATPSKPSAAATLYTGCDYAGQSYDLKEGEYNQAQLTALGLQNNTISSIQVGDGYQVELFINDFHRGRSGTLRQDDPCLVDDRFNDAISSIIVGKDPRAPSAQEKQNQKPVVALFPDCDYKGAGVQLAEGLYDVEALKALGVTNNTVSSIKMLDSHQVRIFDSSRLKSTGMLLQRNDSCLKDEGMDNKLSAIIIEPRTVQASGTTLREIKPPVQQTTTQASRASLSSAIACVQSYVDQGICDSIRWKVMERRCKLTDVAVMTDGYLRGHVDAGNCQSKYWNELSRRVANPALR